MYKWMLLVLLWVAYFIHQGSRQIYPSILPQIKEYFGEGSSAKMGAVMTAFAFTYGITVLFAGFGHFPELPRKEQREYDKIGIQRGGGGNFIRFAAVAA